MSESIKATLTVLDVIRLSVLSAFIWISYKVYSFVHLKLRQTALQGPKAPTFLFGATKLLIDMRTDSLSLYEKWADQYGQVFQIPAPFGSRKIMVCDPKAAAHFYSLESVVYCREPTQQKALGEFVCVEMSSFSLIYS